MRSEDAERVTAYFERPGTVAEWWRPDEGPLAFHYAAELKVLEDVLPDSNVFNDYEVAHEFEGLGRRVMLVNGRRLDHVQLILLGIRDITERKRAEEELRASEEQFRRAVEDAPIPVIMQAEDGQVLQVSQTWTELTGITHEPEVPSAQVKSSILLAGIGADGRTEVIERVRTRDHTERALRALGAPVSPPDDGDDAVNRMVDEDRYCIDVLTQVSAATRALQQVALGLLTDHLRHCVLNAARSDPDTAAAKLDELAGTLRQAMRL